MLRRIWKVLRLTAARWSSNDGNTLAASMAYYGAFSFFPLLLVLISALGFALRFSESAQSAERQLYQFLADNTAKGLADEVQKILAEVKTRAAYNSFGAGVTLLLGAIGIFSQLESAFDRLWHQVTPHEHGVWAAVRNALWNRLKAFLTLIGLGIVVIIAFLSGLLLTALRRGPRNCRLAPGSGIGCNGSSVSRSISSCSRWSTG